MRARWTIVAGLVLAFLVSGTFASAASATDPGRLDEGHVTDVSGVLTPAQEDAAEARLAELAEKAGAELFVVFVPEFTNPSDNVDWVAATANGNGFNSRQYLVGIATEGRTFAIAGPKQDGPISVADREKITDAMLPALRESDWAGAVTAGADKVQDMLVDAPARAATTWAIIGIVALVAVVVVVIVVLVRRARRRAAERARKEQEIADLAQQAGVALVRTDDVVRMSEQEMEYARAQFGDEVIGEFLTALQTSRKNLDEAFSLKQKLDDEIPDTDAQRREWNQRIIQLCSESTQVLEERKADFDALRKLEQNAPEALENVRRLRAAAGAEIDRAEQILATLTATYAATAVSAVTDNPAQARSRLSFTDQQIQAAEQQIAAGETGDAAVSIRAAEGAVQQATQLEDAVERLATDLKTADDGTTGLLAEIQQDLQTAQSLPDADGSVARAMDVARGQVAQAQALLGPSGRDPLTALRVLDAANDALDAVIQHVRDEQAKIAHARSVLGSTIQRADAQIASADGFIRSRRGAISSAARTRLAEAQTVRDQARSAADGDPVAALALAQRADSLATEALRQAQQDVNAWDDGPWGGGGGRGNDDTLGALLGGILIGRASGNRGGGGGWGGGGGGGLFGGGGSSGSSGGFFGGGGGGFSVGGFGGGGGGSHSGSSGGRF
ncbi:MULTISPECIES: TPM domain-containing protein [unclassified Microbacterium]|uniref:TPM domain-containing protein n=1 Tax=unclassified Microbacterium TaxID=2609290 RepID=UPI00300FD5DE